MFTLGPNEFEIHPIAQVSGYQDSVGKRITRWCLKRKVVDSSPRVNIKSYMQVHQADESQLGRNWRLGLHC